MEAFRVEIYDRPRRLRQAFYFSERPDGIRLLAALAGWASDNLNNRHALKTRYTPALCNQGAMPLGQMERWLYDVVITTEKIAIA